MTMISLTDISAGYGTRSVLDAFNLDVPEGSVTALLGESGCGKSTVLRVIAGFLRPTAGRVELGGRVLSEPGVHIATEDRGIGVVPQGGALFPHLDVAGNVGFGLARMDRRARKSRVEEVLALVGLAGLQKARPHELSGGMQQRVAVARALAPKPSVILLDEPFSALDVALRATVRSQVLEALRYSEATVVLVTHDQDEALSAADHVALMRDGRVVQAGAPAEVYGRPADAAAATFLGDCNVLRTTPGRGGRRCILGELPGDVCFDGDLALLRPERITLTTGEATGVRGRVGASSFHGHDVVLTVDIDHDSVLVRLPSATVIPKVGDLVGVEVAAWDSRR